MRYTYRMFLAIVRVLFARVILVAVVLAIGAGLLFDTRVASGGSLVWTARSPMPSAPLLGAGAVAGNGRVYYFGGQGSSLWTTLEYNPANNMWRRVANMSTGRYDLGGAAGPDGKVYAIAGWGSWGWYTGAVEAYDPATNVWTSKAAMPRARQIPACATGTSGLIYAIGGTYYEPYSALNLVDVYNSATNSWITAANMPTARWGLAAVGASNGKIYAIGGYDGSLAGSLGSGKFNPAGILATVEEYDPATNTWTTKSPMPTRRNFLTAVATPDGKIYAIGGFDYIGGTNPYRFLTTVEVYDTATDTWTTETPLTATRSHATGAFVDGVIYVMGGVVNGAWSTAVEAAGVPVVPANTTPTASAGINLTILSDEQMSTVIQGTASDPDGDALTYRWLEGANVLKGWSGAGINGEATLNLGSVPNLSRGSHTLTLEVTDGLATTSDDMILNVDNSAPHAAPNGGGTYQINTSVLIGGQVSDFDGDLLSYEWLEGATVLFSGTIQAVAGGTPYDLTPVNINNLPLGTHTLTLQVSDSINQPVSKSITVVIIDTIAPTLAPAPDKTILWPANHKMVAITIYANASDNSGGPVTLSASVASNEPQDDLGDGDTPQDGTTPVINNGIITLQLRAEKSGKGSGRIYTITIVATDGTGNTSTAKVNISVPHDMGKAK